MHRDRRRPFRPPAPTVAAAPAAALTLVPASEYPTAHSGSRSDLRPAGPFVGREDELAAIGSWLDEAQAGEPRIILVRGDAGIGKSTLLAHVLTDAGAAAG